MSHLYVYAGCSYSRLDGPITLNVLQARRPTAARAATYLRAGSTKASAMRVVERLIALSSQYRLYLSSDSPTVERLMLQRRAVALIAYERGAVKVGRGHLARSA